MSFDIIHKPTGRIVTTSNFEDFLERVEVLWNFTNSSGYAYFLRVDKGNDSLLQMYPNVDEFVIAQDKTIYALSFGMGNESIAKLPDELFEVQMK